jgi:hypothetical protein
VRLEQGGTTPTMKSLLRQVKTTGVAAAALSLTMATASCGGDMDEFEWPDDDPRPRTTQSADPTPSGDPAEIDAVEEILAVVDGYHQTELRTFADPQTPQLVRPAFSEYLADPLLSETLATLNGMYQNGIIYEGRFYWQAEVTELRLAETPPRATIRDCVDASRWRSVFAESGNPVSSEVAPNEHVAWFKAKLYPEGWLLYEGGIRGGELC